MSVCAELKYSRVRVEEWVVPSTLQLDVQRGKGLHSDQVVHHTSSI